MEYLTDLDVDGSIIQKLKLRYAGRVVVYEDTRVLPDGLASTYLTTRDHNPLTAVETPNARPYIK